MKSNQNSEHVFVLLEGSEGRVDLESLRHSLGSLITDSIIGTSIAPKAAKREKYK